MLIGYLNVPTLVALSQVIFALAAVMLASRGYVGFGMAGLLAVGIAELYAGLAAERFPAEDEERPFGAELEHLKNLVAFGILPPLLVDGWIGDVMFYPVFAVYLIAVLYRLAWFKLHGTQDHPESAGPALMGLPLPYGALLLPLAALAAAFVPLLKLPVLGLSLLALAGLYVCQLRIPKPPEKAHPILAALAGLLALLWIWQPWSRF